MRAFLQQERKRFGSDRKAARALIAVGESEPDASLDAAELAAFTMLANLIAAPFNGLLAEAVETRLTGRELPPSSFKKIVKDIGLSIASELRKLAYILPRIIPLMVLLLVPAVGQLLWAVFSAWMLAVAALWDYRLRRYNGAVPRHAGRLSTGATRR